MWIHLVAGLAAGLGFGKNIGGIGNFRLPTTVTKAYLDFCKALGIATFPHAAIEVFTNQVPSPFSVTSRPKLTLHQMPRPAQQHAHGVAEEGNAPTPEQLLAARRQQMAQAMLNAQRVAAEPIPRVVATEENIHELEEMGFSREQAQAALEQSGNSLQLATARLLGD